MEETNSKESAEGAITGPELQRPQEGERQETRTKSPLHIFAAWVARQSTSRLLGLLVGNTRDLETRIAEKDQLLQRQNEELNWWRDRYGSLSDSVLLRQGMLPASGTPVPTTQRSAPGSATQVNRIVSARSIELDTEADRLLEAMQRGDKDVLERIDDLAASPRQKDKEVLKRFNALLAKDAELERSLDIGMGVEVM